MTTRLSLARVTNRIIEALLGITLLIVVAVILMSLLGWVPAGFAYLLFVLVTIFTVRSVPVEPGAWLGLRIVRRALVALIALITVDVLFINGLDIPTLIALVLCDFALGRATRRIAGAPDAILDERQAIWRDRSYRFAYIILAVAAGGVLAASDFASSGTRQWLANSLQHGGAFISFVQLLAFLPSMVIAWTEPDRITGPDLPRLRQGLVAQLAGLLVALCLVIPIILSLSIVFAPIRISRVTHPEAISQTTASNCMYFGAREEVGVGFGATVPLNAVACWNGTTAYESWGLNASDCVIYGSDFATVSTLECRRSTQPDGTLRFTYRARVQSMFLPFITRDVALTLALTKNGKVVQFP
jgi:hypothetical protein